MTVRKENGVRPIRVSILGVRGIPAAHGGFETFAERLAPYLVSVGWDVTVYCQEDRSTMTPARDAALWRSVWHGVKRVHISVAADTPANTILFDLRCVSHVVAERPDVVLVLGYNTAIFSLRLRAAGITTVINMDGIEWARAKWSVAAKAWLYLNERAGCLFAHHLIADHPQIGLHLRSRVSARKISVIPYGAEIIPPGSGTDETPLRLLGLEPGRFATVIARAEPENSILEIVAAFSAKSRGIKLVVLGNYYADKVRYHAQVMAAAGPEVLFPGAIYDKATIHALRIHSRFHLHGHQVGGCNPSLLESMGAGNAIVAHDNRFNRWVAGAGALYFTDRQSCAAAIEYQLQNDTEAAVRSGLNRRRAADIFSWSDVMQSYRQLLTDLTSGVGADAEMGLGRRATWQINTDSS